MELLFPQQIIRTILFGEGSLRHNIMCTTHISFYTEENTCRLCRVTIWKGGQSSCIFNCCIEKGISAGLICIYGNSPFLTTFKAAGALPSFKSGHSSRAPAALTVVMTRKFHQVLHIYKWDLELIYTKQDMTVIKRFKAGYDCYEPFKTVV